MVRLSSFGWRNLTCPKPPAPVTSRKIISLLNGGVSGPQLLALMTGVVPEPWVNCRGIEAEVGLLSVHADRTATAQSSVTAPVRVGIRTPRGLEGPTGTASPRGWRRSKAGAAA